MTKLYRVFDAVFLYFKFNFLKGLGWNILEFSRKQVFESSENFFILHLIFLKWYDKRISYKKLQEFVRMVC